MDIDIGGALSNAWERTIAPNGMKLAGAIILLNVISSTTATLLLPADGAGLPEAVLMQRLGVMALIMLGVAAANLVVTIGMIRTMVSDEREALPKSFFTHNLGLALLYLIIGGFLTAAATVIGLLFFIIPGIYIALALMFFNYRIIVEDEPVFEAMQNSWEMTKGHKIGLFVFMLILMVLVALPQAVVIGLTALIGSEIVANVLFAVAAGAVTVYSVAAVAQVYQQLRP